MNGRDVSIVLILVVELLGAGSLVLGLLWVLFRATGHHPLRRAGWFGVGMLGIPTLALSDLYIVGFTLSAGFFWTAAFCARWRNLDYAVTAIMSIPAGAWFISSLPYSSDAVPSLLLAISGIAATISVVKLGRTFGRDALWERDPRDAVIRDVPA